MAASRYGDRTVFFFWGEEQSFNELSERSNKVANAITELGIEPDERVCLYVPNSLQFPEAIFGIIKSGAVPVPLNLRMPPRTLLWVVKNSDAKTIVASTIETGVSSPDRAKELAEGSGIEHLILPGESENGIVDYNKIVEEASPEFDLPRRDYDDVAVRASLSPTKMCLLASKVTLNSLVRTGLSPPSRPAPLPRLWAHRRLGHMSLSGGEYSFPGRARCG